MSDIDNGEASKSNSLGVDDGEFERQLENLAARSADAGERLAKMEFEEKQRYGKARNTPFEVPPVETPEFIKIPKKPLKAKKAEPSITDVMDALAMLKGEICELRENQNKMKDQIETIKGLVI